MDAWRPGADPADTRKACGGAESCFCRGGKKGAMYKNIHVETISQSPNWPKGSSAVCAVMLLRHLGMQIQVDEFIDNFLPQSKIRYRDGILYGPDPDLKFAGSPYDPKSFGCYPGAMVRALNECFAQKGMLYRAEDATGIRTTELLREGIDNDIPVLYWVTEDLQLPRLELSWTIKETDRKVNWYANTMCALLTGYGDETLVFAMPGPTAGVEEVNRKLAVKRHAELGKRTVLVRRI